MQDEDAKDLISEFDNFKEVIVKKVQDEITKAVAEAKSKGVLLSPEELSAHDQLEAAVSEKVKEWSENELKAGQHSTTSGLFGLCHSGRDSKK